MNGVPDRPDDFLDAAESDETEPGADPGANYDAAVAAGEAPPTDDDELEREDGFPGVGDVFRSGS